MHGHQEELRCDSHCLLHDCADFRVGGSLDDIAHGGLGGSRNEELRGHAERVFGPNELGQLWLSILALLESFLHGASYSEYDACHRGRNRGRMVVFKRGRVLLGRGYGKYHSSANNELRIDLFWVAFGRYPPGPQGACQLGAK